MDVQRRWFCSLVTSRNYVRHYVDIRVLQGLLQAMFKINDNQKYFNFRGNMLLNLYTN